MLGYRNIFVSSDDCYVGETSNGMVKVGFYLDLVNDPKVIESTIDFDNLIWLEEKAKLSKVLKNAIGSYQKQYGVVVSNIAMVGKVYRNGKEFDYGRLIPANINPLDYFPITDNSVVEVGIDDNDELIIKYDNGLNDNVSVIVNLYVITVSKIKRLTKNRSFTGIVIDDYLNIQRKSSAIKIKKESVLI